MQGSIQVGSHSSKKFLVFMVIHVFDPNMLSRALFSELCFGDNAWLIVVCFLLRKYTALWFFDPISQSKAIGPV